MQMSKEIIALTMVTRDLLKNFIAVQSAPITIDTFIEYYRLMGETNAILCIVEERKIRNIVIREFIKNILLLMQGSNSISSLMRSLGDPDKNSDIEDVWLRRSIETGCDFLCKGLEALRRSNREAQVPAK